LLQKIFFYFLFFILLTACTQKPSEKPQYNEYTGVLVVVGNEPFTSFALDDGQGHISRLKTEKNMEAKLNKLQGSMIRVYGIPLPKEKSIQLKSFEIYKKKAE
jgi:hypothetical protein